MKRQFVVNVVTTLGVAWLGLAGTPVFAQTTAPTGLNAELSQAVCQQDWARAIRVVDQMRNAAPSRQGDLALYRSRLQSMLNSQTVIPNWQCGANSTPSLPNTLPATTSNRSPVAVSDPSSAATPNATASNNQTQSAAPDNTIRGFRPGSSSSGGASTSGSASSSGTGSDNIINRARNLNPTTSNP